MSVADSDDENLMGMEKSRIGTSTTFSKTWRSRSSTDSCPKTKSTWKSSNTVKGLPRTTRHLMHDGTDKWRKSEFVWPALPAGPIRKWCPRTSKRSLSSSRHRTCPLAESCTAALMTSRFWDIESHGLKQIPSHQQRGLLSEITSQSAQALEAHRHSPVQEATAKMVRRDTSNADSLTLLRSELQLYLLRGEGQSDLFCWDNQAELRQHLERWNSGAASKELFDRIAPEVVRVQAREDERSTVGSTMQSQETEPQRQLQNLHREEARISDLLNQMHITKLFDEN